jgi:streptomycin 6-kinase
MDADAVDVAPWLDRLGLEVDGYPFSSPYTRSLLQPVRYRGRPAMLKVASAPEEIRGAAMMVWWAGEGAAPVLAHEGPALLLPRASNPEGLADMAFNGQDDAATAILCDVAAQLHRPRPRPPPEPVPLDRRLRALQASASQGGVYACAARIAGDLLAQPEQPAVLHGDITHANVLHFDGLGWLAIDPKGVVGERGYDYANLFRSPTVETVTPERLRRQLTLVSDRARLDRARLLKWVFVHSVVALAWASEDGHRFGRRALRFPQMAAAELGIAL